MKTIVIQPKDEKQFELLKEILEKYQIEMQVLGEEEQFKETAQEIFLEGYSSKDSIYDAL